MKQRITSIDVAKGIAMAAIVFGHLGLAALNPWLFTFHVPVFFVISGFFVSNKSSVKEFIIKKFKTLIVPYWITCLVMIGLVILGEWFFHGFAAGWGPVKDWIYAALYGAGNDYWEPFYIKGIGAIWFLWALFWASLFLRLSLNLDPFKRMLMIGLLFLFGYYTKFWFWFPLSFQAGCTCTFYMYMGWLGFQNREKFLQLSKEVRWVILALAALIWISFIRDFGAFWIVSNTFGRGIIDIFGSLCASLVVLVIAAWIDRHLHLVASYFDFLGLHSLLLLCLHILELNLFPWYRIQEMMLPWLSWEWTALVVGFMKIIILSIGTWLLIRIPIVRKIYG